MKRNNYLTAEVVLCISFFLTVILNKEFNSLPIRMGAVFSGYILGVFYFPMGFRTLKIVGVPIPLLILHGLLCSMATITILYSLVGVNFPTSILKIVFIVYMFFLILMGTIIAFSQKRRDGLNYKNMLFRSVFFCFFLVLMLLL